MTTMSAYLRTCERAVIFQVTGQDHNIDNYLKTLGYYEATNGWTVRSAQCPEVDLRNKVIFLRGHDTEKNRRVSRVWDLSSQHLAESTIAQVDIALKEFVNAVSNNVITNPRIARYGMDFEYSTPLSSTSRTNYKSNRPTITA